MNMRKGWCPPSPTSMHLWWNNFPTISKDYHTFEMKDVFCKLQVDEIFPSQWFIHYNFGKYRETNLWFVISEYFKSQLPTRSSACSGNALVVEVHWRGGERRAELCINFWPIRYLCNYALCTMHPFSPATIPYFCNYAWQAWTFHQLPISAPHPPCLKTERSKLHQKIRNLNKEVKIAWARLQIPSTDYGLH